MPVKGEKSLPKYHPMNDGLINCMLLQPHSSHSKKKTKSLKMRIQNTKDPTRERSIPKNKKKKYPTKPKNNSKIAKLKESRINF